MPWIVVPHPHRSSGMGRQITVEVCLDSLQSARTVQKVSAEFEGRVKWRIELCSNLIHGGGMTPSMGLIRSIRQLLPAVDIMAMIRPRIGNFTYSEDEITVMENDIRSVKGEGVTGFVYGCLTPSHEIDFISMTRLCKAAGDLPVTFHRAFDLIKGSFDAVPRLKEEPGMSNITRILTSGGSQTALSGIDQIQPLMRYHTGPGFAILPGSGINALTLRKLLWRLDGLSEIHLTASSAVAVSQEKTGMYVTHEDQMMSFGFGLDQIWTMDEAKLRAVFEIIDIEDQADGNDPQRWMAESYDDADTDPVDDMETNADTDAGTDDYE